MDQIGRGLLRVIPPANLEAMLQRDAEAGAAAEDAARQSEEQVQAQLSGYIDNQFEMMKRHRNGPKSGWSDRLLAALRTFNGEYDPTRLAEIRKFGGSDVYARVVAMKCRGASALLRDVYLSPQKPWGLDPPADPDVPTEILAKITQLVEVETRALVASGVQVDLNMLRDRTMQLILAARDAAKRKAGQQAAVSEQKIDEILTEGGFYKALAEFITDLPLFPFACIKGPVVRIVPRVEWVNGKPVVQQKPRLMWMRVSPFDIWWTPGVNDIEDGAVIERTRVTRADLNDLLDLPGYNTQAVRAVLTDYGRGGIVDDWDSTDSERADMESRENPHLNQSGLITCLEFHGNVQGSMLLEAGMDETVITDPVRDYFVQAWKIGRYVIKVQMSPSPRRRHPYYITSFEKVPGTPVGNGLPDILSDIQDVANATLRALVNNMSIASGPQVWINEDRAADGENTEELYPWKRWHMKDSPMGGGSSSQPPVGFFQPNSNAQELLGVYQQFMNMADDLSAIPKYLQGNGTGGGAGRTASGLAMLMNNASKILQTVAANIDRDVVEPALQQLVDLVMLTDETGLLTGQERVVVKGVNVAVQKETQRSRQLEFLQITANPIDMQIIGPKGRAEVLRAVAETIGMDGSNVVPDAETLEKMMQAMNAAPPPGPEGAAPGGDPMGQAAAQAQGGQQSPPGTGDMGPRTNLQQQRPQQSSGVPRVSGGVQ
jgi:hypothetical protein